MLDYIIFFSSLCCSMFIRNIYIIDIYIFSKMSNCMHEMRWGFTLWLFKFHQILNMWNLLFQPSFSEKAFHINEFLISPLLHLHSLHFTRTHLVVTIVTSLSFRYRIYLSSSSCTSCTYFSTFICFLVYLKDIMWCVCTVHKVLRYCTFPIAYLLYA